MKIVVAVRCRNEVRHVSSFLTGYSFADQIVISDGGSTDGSVEAIKAHPLYEKVKLLHFNQEETVNGYTWNEDAPHMNFVLDAAKELKPDWLIFDDMDCHPNALLRNDARVILENCPNTQANAFRLYLWGDTGKHFPHMNRDFHPDYVSLWAWRPEHIDIHADPNVRHGTMVGVDRSYYKINKPYCLLHRSWYPGEVEEKIARYNALGLPMNHPLEDRQSFGELKELPEWARDE